MQKFYGPFQVDTKVGSVAYRIQLPPGSCIHPLCHVSQLKKKLSNSQQLSPQLPLVDDDGHMRVEPVHILERRLVKRNNRAVTQILAEWSNSMPEDATWEDYYAIKNQLPSFEP